MKKTYTVLCMLLLTFSLGAQSSYQFTATTAPYVELTGTTVLSTNMDQMTYPLPLPSVYRAFGHDIFGNLSVGVNGFTVATWNDYSFAFDPALCNFDKRDNSSMIHYRIDGDEGQRILKIEWKNMRFDTVDTDFASFQCWLYEEDQSIEFRYGKSFVSASNPVFGGKTGPTVGIFLLSKDFLTAYDVRSVNGTPASPTVSNGGNFNGFPAENSVFRFSYLHVGIKNPGAEKKDFTVYPNPAKTKITIRKSGNSVSVLHYSLYEISGRKVISGTTDNGSIPVSALSNGTYLLRLSDNSGNLIFSETLIIQ